MVMVMEDVTTVTVDTVTGPLWVVLAGPLWVANINSEKRLSGRFFRFFATLPYFCRTLQ